MNLDHTHMIIFYILQCYFAGEIYTGSNDSVIQFTEVAKPEYRGDYVCRAENYLGSLSKQIFVNILCEYRWR